MYRCYIFLGKRCFYVNVTYALTVGSDSTVIDDVSPGQYS